MPAVVVVVGAAVVAVGAAVVVVDGRFTVVVVELAAGLVVTVETEDVVESGAEDVTVDDILVEVGATAVMVLSRAVAVSLEHPVDPRSTAANKTRMPTALIDAADQERNLA